MAYMKDIYESQTLSELTTRIDALSSNSPAQWGKMNVAQMLQHCCIPIDAALKGSQPKRSLKGYLIALVAKNMITNDQPFKRNLPTDPTFVVADQVAFEEAKATLLQLIGRLSKGGPTYMEAKPHPFLGKLTAKEWSNIMYKHLDHHLTQFGA
jgi:hypothetical protein